MARTVVRSKVAVLVAVLAVGLVSCARSETAAKVSPRVGAPGVGSTAYPIPAGARFVAPGGNDAAAGTAGAPWRTVRRAIEASPSGTTIVLRAGTYREAVEIPATKRLTLQPYPREAVWFSGSQPVSGWVGDGGDWRRDGWTTRFDHGGLNSTLIDPAYPMAGHPDMAFIDGYPLRQVASRAAVAPGTFFVDEGASRLWIGTNPSGRQVEGTVLAEGLNVKSAGSVVRGLGFRHYGTHISRHGAVKAAGSRVIVFENEFSDNAAAGLSVTGPDIVVSRNTFRRNGQIGLHADHADRLWFDANLVSDNNRERFYPAAAAGGAKITASAGVTLKSNVADDNYGHGLWLDEGSNLATIVGNVTRRNARAAGIMFEYSTGALIAGNVSTDNEAGIQAGESSAVEVWNNTMVNNIYALKGYDGYRPPVPKGMVVRNNVFSAGSASSRPMVINEDANVRRTWIDMGWSSNNNAFSRRSSGTTPYVGALANGTRGKLLFRSTGEITRATGLERNSLSVDNVGADPFVANAARGDYRLPVGSPARGRGAPLPAHVARALGVTAGVPVNIGVL